MDKKYEIRDDGRVVDLRVGPWGPASTVGGFAAHQGNVDQQSAY